MEVIVDGLENLEMESNAYSLPCDRDDCSSYCAVVCCHEGGCSDRDGGCHYF